MFLCFLILGMVPMMVIKETIMNSYMNRAVAVRSTEVQNQCKILSNQLVSSNYLKARYSEMVDNELAQLSNLYDGRILIISHQERILNIADTIIVMKAGQVDKVGSREEILPALLGSADAGGPACSILTNKVEGVRS